MSLGLLIAMALASYRLYRIFALDSWPPSEWLRSRLHAKAATGGLVHRTFSRGWWWQELETMLLCPWCLGFWTSLAVVLIVDALVGLSLPALQLLAVSCLVGLIGGNLDS